MATTDTLSKLFGAKKIAGPTATAFGPTALEGLFAGQASSNPFAMANLLGAGLERQPIQDQYVQQLNRAQGLQANAAAQEQQQKRFNTLASNIPALTGMMGNVDLMRAIFGGSNNFAVGKQVSDVANRRSEQATNALGVVEAADVAGVNTTLPHNLLTGTGVGITGRTTPRAERVAAAGNEDPLGVFKVTRKGANYDVTTKTSDPALAEAVIKRGVRGAQEYSGDSDTPSVSDEKVVEIAPEDLQHLEDTVLDATTRQALSDPTMRAAWEKLVYSRGLPRITQVLNLRPNTRLGLMVMEIAFEGPDGKDEVILLDTKGNVHTPDQ